MSFGIPVRNGLGLGLLASTSLATRNSSVFTPASLFTGGVQGVWYDPSDFSTLFQDSAGTTPVTAVEQPVGRMLDLSGNNNHATQSTSAARPVLSARVNLLTRTQEFENAVWSKLGVTVTSNQGIAPDGTNTADLAVVNNGAQANVQLYQDMTALVASSSYTMSASVKKSGARYAVVGWLFSAGVFGAVSFDFDTQTVSRSATAGGFVIVSSSIVSEGNGWYRITVTATTPVTAGFSRFPCVFPRVTAWTSGSPDTTDTGNGTDGILVWGADLRPTNDGVGLPAYQRVNTSTDYNTTNFPLYLRFDGTDDSMATGSISFTSTDKMTVFGGVRKINDTVSIYTELSANLNSSAGSFLLLSGTNNVTGFEGTSRGSAPAALGTTARFAIAAPVTAIVTDIFDISAPLARIRVNGVVGTDGTSSQGTGNYGNYPLYIGSRAGPSLPFNGRIYSLIIRGAASTAQQISNTETWVNGKTKAY